LVPTARTPCTGLGWPARDCVMLAEKAERELVEIIRKIIIRIH